jgi:chitodextrinase
MILSKSYIGGNAVERLYLGTNLIYQLTPPTPFEDYYNLVVDFGTNNHVTFDQQPTWLTNPPTDDFVHPSTLYFENGWNGHNYWMYITGYADTQGVTENPYLFYSDDDGYTWQTPVGTPAPIHTYNSDGVTDTAHLSDSWAVMEGNTMHLFNRGNLTAGGTYWEYRSTTDGVNFTARQRLTFSGVAASTDYVSSSFILIDGTWYMFGTDSSSQTELAVLTSTSLNGTWTEINRIASDSGALWHSEVHYNPDDTNFYVLGSTGFISGGNLMFGKFSDVMAASMETRNTFLLPRNDQTWNVAYYKSSFIIKDNAMELFLGCKGAAVDSNTDWRVQKVTTSRLSPTLDLSDYNLIDTYDLPSVANGFTAGIKDLGYNKVALQFTFTDVDAFDVQVARLNTTSFFRLYMVGNTLYFRDWNTGADQPIVYGIAIDDVVTIIRDETNYTLYVNGNNVFQTTAPHDEDLGTLFGDFANSSSIKDLKVYMKPEWIFSKPIFDYRLSETFTDASINTTNYLLVDNFNRPTLGTTDLNGTTYNIIGTPTINSDTRLATGEGNIIGLNHAETDYTIYVNPAQTDFNSGRVYFNYTDANNCLYLDWQDGGTVNRFAEIVAGVTTYTTVDIVGQHSNYEKYILEVDDTVLNIYADNVFVGSATIPTVASTKFVGIQTGYSSRYVDDFIVAKGLLPVLNLTPPTAPSNLVASNVIDTSLDLTWTASTNDSGISDYNIYNNDVLIGSVGSNATSYTATGLTASTLYNFTVRGVDNLGTESVNSNIETVTTEAPDTQAPTAPTNLVASNVTDTTVDLTWTASTDNLFVDDYKIYNSGVLVDSVGSNATSYTLTGLTEATQYILTVRGLDASLNESTDSNSQTFTTDPLVLSKVIDLDVAPSSGSTWTDASGSGNNGTLNGTYIYTAANGGGITTSSTDSYISTPLTVTSPFSFEIVMSFDDTQPTWASVFGMDSWIAGLGWLGYVASDGAFTFHRAGAETPSAKILVSDGFIWGNINHIVGTCDGTEIKLYLNSVLIDTAIINATTPTNTLQIGARHNNSGASDSTDNGIGTYYKIRVYDEVLTDSNVLTVFNNIKNTYGL